MAEKRKWGTAVAATAWFLRPTPMTELRTQLTVVTEGGRVSIVDNTLWPANEEQPCAMARVMLSRERAVEVRGLRDTCNEVIDPTRYPLRATRAGHDRTWFMDAMEARAARDAAWFRLHHPVIAGAGPLSRVIGPADWAHGIARPHQNVVADPNPNLTVQLFRVPRDEWIGVRAQARWWPETGLGVGGGILLDVHGEIGRVSMSVILLPFPKPELASLVASAANYSPGPVGAR